VHISFSFLLLPGEIEGKNRKEHELPCLLVLQIYRQNIPRIFNISPRMRNLFMLIGICNIVISEK
jgi:hypothetical protein